MKKIRKVGVWPVGLVGGLMVEKPICDNATNKVIGFNAAWKPDRPFPIDMAGFAINLKLLLENNDAVFSYDVQGGYQESEILRQIVTRDELEPLADSCTKVSIRDCIRNQSLSFPTTHSRLINDSYYTFQLLQN